MNNTFPIFLWNNGYHAADSKHLLKLQQLFLFLCHLNLFALENEIWICLSYLSLLYYNIPQKSLWVSIVYFHYIRDINNDVLIVSFYLLVYHIRRCPVPLWIWKNLGLWKKIQQKFFCKKLCLWTYCKLNLLIFCLFFLFKYDAVIIKQPSSCTFDIKVVLFKNFGKFLKIKNHRCLVSSRIWGSVGRLGD